MSVAYPPTPANVPAELNEAPKAFWWQLAGAVSAVVMMVGAYLALVLFLILHVWTAVGVLSGATVGVDPVFSMLSAAGALVLLALLLMPLLSLRRSEGGGGVEVTRDQQPDLFAFLERIADEVGAPRPARVLVTAEVNAAVFYEQDALSLLFPRKKSLILGLGLVNAVTLDELKAVLAHEFGHFSQGSMRVASWVYVAHQVSARLVGARSAIDDVIDWISRIDLRVAWIGWGLGALAWSIRVVTEDAFLGVLRVSRALTRQMEFLADRAAVRVSGSDSLVHALARLPAADEALAFAWSQLAQDLPSRRADDVFLLQEHLLNRVRIVLHDPLHGRVPERPAEGAASHRVLPKEVGVPPAMYATHPPSNEREEAVKAFYVPSALDERPAWVLFREPEALRRQVTAQAFAERVGPGAAGATAPECVPSLALLPDVDARLDRGGFDARHRGAYLDRDLTRQWASLDQAWDADLPAAPDRGDVLARLDKLYPESLGERLRTLRQRRAELGQLKSLMTGSLVPAGGRLEFRGAVVERAQLPDLVSQVEVELAAAEASIAEHDREVRSAHRVAARLLNPAAEAELVGLVAFLRYLEHGRAVLAIESRDIGRLWAHIARDGKITQDERNLMMVALEHAWTRLRDVLGVASKLEPPARVFPERAAWGERLGGFAPGPEPGSAEGDFQPAAFFNRLSFVAGALARTDRDTVNALLKAEDAVADALRSERAAAEAAPAGSVPSTFPTVAPHQEDAQEHAVPWGERFRLGLGFPYAQLRFAVASLLLGGSLLAVARVDADVKARTPDLRLLNGFAVDREVEIQGQRHLLRPGTVQRVSNLEAAAKAEATVRGEGDEVLAKHELVLDPWSPTVLNVGRGEFLVEWTVAYGDVEGGVVPLGTPEVIPVAAYDFVLEAPPRRVTAKKATTRRGLVALRDLAVELPTHLHWQVMTQLAAERREDGIRWALDHLSVDPYRAEETWRWVELLDNLGVDHAALSGHPAAVRRDIVELQVLLQQIAPEDELPAMRELWAARALADPGDADAAFLSLTLEPVAERQLAGVRAALERSPGHPFLSWLLAEAIRGSGSGDDAVPALHQARRHPALAEVALGAVVDLLWRGGRKSEAAAAAADATGALQGNLLAERLAVALNPDSVRATIDRVREELDEPQEVAARLWLASGQPDQLGVDDPAPTGVLAWAYATSVGAPPDALRTLAARPLEDDASSMSSFLWFAARVRLGLMQATDAERLEALAPQGLVPVVTAELVEGATVRSYDAFLHTLEARVQAGFAWVGLVRFGDEAPERWRVLVRDGILPGDGPHL